MENIATNARGEGGKSASQASQTSQHSQADRQQRITRTSDNFSPSTWTGRSFDTMMRLSREMDQLMDSFFGGRLGFPRFGRDLGARAGSPELWTPRVDMRQSGENLLITAELPGIERNQVQIEATEEGIAISGERRDTREEGSRGGDYHLTERSYGSFYRTIPLPENAQADQAKASMRDGVLEISIPCKQVANKRRAIQISD